MYNVFINQLTFSFYVSCFKLDFYKQVSVLNLLKKNVNCLSNIESSLELSGAYDVSVYIFQKRFTFA